MTKKIVAHVTAGCLLFAMLVAFISLLHPTVVAAYAVITALLLSIIGIFIHTFLKDKSR